MISMTACEHEGVFPQWAVPRPFLKWVGGKGQLIDRMLPLVPSFSGTYHEPFLGGGALFFALRPRRAILCDSNRRLVRTYRGLRDDPEEVIRRLRESPYDKDYYLAQRDRAIDEVSDVDVAIWLIYLNRTGFNGLYRVNRRDQFNVPFGRHVRPLICDEANLRACSTVLQRAQVLHDTFESVEDRARPGDFVYFDPPYEPVSSTSRFTSYTSIGFSLEDQCRLRDLSLRLKRRGVQVLISNSAARPVYDLYHDHFEIQEVQALRKVNCRRDGRGRITELLIR
jgi:DNA adenine methylase